MSVLLFIKNLLKWKLFSILPQKFEVQVIMLKHTYGWDATYVIEDASVNAIVEWLQICCSFINFN